jgi:hypothetical protein
MDLQGIQENADANSFQALLQLTRQQTDGKVTDNVREVEISPANPIFFWFNEISDIPEYTHTV